MKLKINQKFPCGYEISLDADSGWRDIDSTDFKLGICPLHGSNCKATADNKNLTKDSSKEIV